MIRVTHTWSWKLIVRRKELGILIDMIHMERSGRWAHASAEGGLSSPSQAYIPKCIFRKGIVKEGL